MFNQNSKEIEQNKVRELVDDHPTFHESDFDGGFIVLRDYFGFWGATHEYLKGWLTALLECYRHGYGVDPRMATAFLNATVNLKDRRGDYEQEIHSTETSHE